MTSRLLTQNPEYYTIWNEHRRILRQHFDFLSAEAKGLQETASSSLEDCHDEIKELLRSDLAFIFPLLVKFPKCYWIWNHRQWLLQQASQRLSSATSRKFWMDELALATKMLAKDSRNFHGWGYRRMVVTELENESLSSQGETSFKNRVASSMVRSEFEYTTRMINTNLSNFSAWHNRSRLIPRLLQEEEASEETRRKLLDDGGHYKNRFR